MVSSVAQSGTNAVAAPSAVARRPRPEDIFNALDTGAKGYLTQDDLQSAIVSISSQGQQMSQADAQAIAKDAFRKLDANQDGQATLEEFKQAAPKDGPPPGGPAQSGQGPQAGQGPQGAQGGPPPGAGGPRGAGGGGGNAAATGSSSTSYDPADTNQDGTVSQLERLAYSAKENNAAAQVAIKTYQSISQSGA